MFALTLFTIFESLLFPRSIFLGDQFNPASLKQQGMEVNIGTGVNFGLSDLRTYAIHSKIESYDISILSFGNDIYRENMISAGMSFPVTEKCAAGISAAVLNYWVEGNYNRFSYSLKIAGLYQNSAVEIGAWVNNINIPKFSSIDYLPPNYSMRFTCFTKKNLCFIFAIRGIELDLPFFNFGFTYSPYKMITFGTGINTDPMYVEYTAKLNLKNFILQYTGSNHRYLSLSHFLSVCFST